MTKAYEKDKRFLETQQEQRIHFHETSPQPNTAVNNTNENLESTANKTCHSRKHTRNVQTAYRKIQKNWDREPTKHYEKDTATLPNSRYLY